jgi:hypothetical protein
MKSVLGLFLVVVLAGGCSGPTVLERASPAPARQPLGAVEPVVQEGHRAAFRRDVVKLPAAAASRNLIAAAMSDLKDLGMWGELTRHLDRVRLRTRWGRANVPRDGHLADSLYRPWGTGGGRFCRVTFYPRAMRDDLAKQRFYHAEGRLAGPPPKLDQFWTMILAHELTHCRDRHRGETIALRVETRVLELLRRR